MNNINYNDIVELSNKLYTGENIKLTDDECLELSDLFKKSEDFENAMQHYFKEFEDTGITEDEKKFIESHIFSFEFYIIKDNIYLIVDENKLDTPLIKQTEEFKDKFYNILQRKKK